MWTKTATTNKISEISFRQFLECRAALAPLYTFRWSYPLLILMQNRNINIKLLFKSNLHSCPCWWHKHCKEFLTEPLHFVGKTLDEKVKELNWWWGEANWWPKGWKLEFLIPWCSSGANPRQQQEKPVTNPSEFFSLHLLCCNNHPLYDKNNSYYICI